MTLTRPTIAANVRDYMRAEIDLYQGFVEVAFACGFDLATKTVTSARLMARGHSNETFVVQGDLSAGMMAVHSHPNAAIVPSDLDLRCADVLADRGIGFGITNNDGSLFFVVREPVTPKPRPRAKAFRLGRLIVAWDVAKEFTAI